jgi:transposase
LAEQVFATLPSGLQRDLLLDELEYFDRRITQVEKGLKTLADGHPGVSLLRSIPGVGPRTAEAIVAYIDKAQRFSRNKTLGSYFGLVPCQDQSAGSNRLGHITQEGPATVRKLLVEAAWQGIRRSAHIRAYFQRVQAADPNRKKVALVATAHYLVRVMHAMLRTGEMWRYDQKEKTAA